MALILILQAYCLSQVYDQVKAGNYIMAILWSCLIVLGVDFMLANQ